MLFVAAAMAKPCHAKVVTLFERMMKEDRGIYGDLFHPDADHISWFGTESGKVTKPQDQRRPGGPIKFYNRVQYFGDGVFAETHDAVYENGKSIPVLVVCTVDDAGLITRFEEWLDPGYLQKERPVPPPAAPPTHVSIFSSSSGDAATNQQMITDVFHRIMSREDISHLFTRSARLNQIFGPELSMPLPFNKRGELKMGSVKGAPPDFGQYTNRRQFAGDGWAIELHTANVALNLKKPERRYSMECVALLLKGSAEFGKFEVMDEYADPSTMKRIADAPLAAQSKI